MSANVWNPGSDYLVVDAQSTNVFEAFTAAAGQTLFILSAFSYTVGSGSIAVYRNGQRLTLGVDFLETASDKVTLTGITLAAGESITIYAVIGSASESAMAAAASAEEAGSFATSANISALNAAASASSAATSAAEAEFVAGLTTGSTKSVTLPVGTTAQRDVSPQNGYIRYNSDLLIYEGYNNGAWRPLSEHPEEQRAGLKNLVINGNCLISSRGDYLLNTVGAVRYGGADRIAALPWGWTSFSGTMQRLTTSLPTFLRGYAQTLTSVNTVGSGDIMFLTRLEASHVRRLAGKTVTFSCLAYHAVGTAVNAVAIIGKANAVDNFTTVTNIAGGAVTAVSSSLWTRISVTVALSTTDTATGLQLQLAFTGLGALSNKFFATGEWQLEEGAFYTAFEDSPYSLQQILCSRYCYKTTLGILAYGPGGSQVGAYQSLPVHMRATPTVATGSPTLTNCSALNIPASTEFLYPYVTVTATGTASANIPVVASAEL